MSFEEELKKLEQLTERLRDENTGLEESLKIYENWFMKKQHFLLKN